MEEATVSEEELLSAIGELRKNRGTKDRPAELSDDFVKTLGNFGNVADFRDKLKEIIKLDKIRRNKEKRRLSIIERIAENSKLTTPRLLVETECERMMAELNANLGSAGVKISDYLTQIKKSQDDVRNELVGNAEKRVKNRIILSEIAKRENIKVTPEEVEVELKHLKEHYKNSPLENLRGYLQMVLTNEKVLEFLENQKS